MLSDSSMHGRAEAFRLCLAEGAFEGSVPIFYHTPHFVLQCETMPALNFAPPFTPSAGDSLTLNVLFT